MRYYLTYCSLSDYPQTLFSDFLSPSDCSVLIYCSSFSAEKCFNSSDNGQNYRGPVAKSITEMPCLEWTSVNSSFTEERYPELIGAGNSCRNPGRWGLAPWCFVSKYHAELCLVSSCTDSGEQFYTNCVCVYVFVWCSFYTVYVNVHI